MYLTNLIYLSNLTFYHIPLPSLFLRFAPLIQNCLCYTGPALDNKGRAVMYLKVNRTGRTKERDINQGRYLLTKP